MNYRLLLLLVLCSLVVFPAFAQETDDEPQGDLLVPITVEIPREVNGTPLPPDYVMQIFRLTADGKQRFQLTDTETDETDPHWSPDGTQIVFVSQRDGTDQIYVMDADGSNQRNLTNQPGKYLNRPAWSPDGSQIMFATSVYDMTAGASFWEIHVMDADGSNQRNLSSEHLHNDYDASWSPDGTRIVFTGMAADQKSSAIYVMDADGSNVRALTDPAGQANSPRWSPDGTQIVYENTYSDSVLYIVDADGSNNRVLNEATRNPKDLIWSPDGTSIAYIDSINGVNELFIMDADGGNLRQLAPQRGVADSNFAWSPDGTQIVATVNLMSPDLGRLMVIDVASGERTLIVDDAYCGYKPDWRKAEE